MSRDDYANQKLKEYEAEKRPGWLKRGPGHENTWAVINAKKRAYKKAWHEYNGGLTSERREI